LYPVTTAPVAVEVDVKAIEVPAQRRAVAVKLATGGAITVMTRDASCEVQAVADLTESVAVYEPGAV
jgi:hypothetical protein